MLINAFLEWSKGWLYFGWLLLPAKGVYFEVPILCSMAESIIQPEPFPKDFCIFDIIVA